MLQQLERNRTQVLERIARAAAAAGRDPSSIELVAVTKSVEPALAAALFELGTQALGENRADELETKARALREQGLAPRWHFVGHLQRNKARRVLAVADAIHSVDSGRLLETLIDQMVSGRSDLRPSSARVRAAVAYLCAASRIDKRESWIVPTVALDLDAIEERTEICDADFVPPPKR